MIIDADVHLSLTERNGLTAEQALRGMDRAGIDRANIWLQPPYMRAIDDANLYIHQAAALHPDRFAPSGWVDPNYGLDRAMETLLRCTDIYGMRVIKLNGAQNSFYIDDEPLFKLYAALDERKCGLALHIGADFYDFTHPTRAVKIAKAFPDLRILVVHMGGAGVPNLAKASIEAAAACPNMLLVGSAISYLSVMEAIRTLGAGRVCFGSDAPFAMMHVEKAAYDAFLPDVTDSAGYQKVMGENIADFLG
ncbi:MAG: amidohydrolase family protein [Clostridia bacterium]|nr:amidohydrolase family protein [Clostridia bacterium]